MEKTRPERADFYAKLAPSGEGIEHKKMFGYPASFVNGNMFAGLHGNRLILRLPEAVRARFETFEPMPGRPMKEYAVIPDSAEAELPQLFATALEWVRKLPPKAKKTKKKA